MKHENREEVTGPEAVEAVKLLASIADDNLPRGYVDKFDFDDDDPFLRIPMNSSYDIVMYGDGYVLIDGGEVLPEELALDILSLLTVFRYYLETGLI